MVLGDMHAGLEAGLFPEPQAVLEHTLALLTMVSAVLQLLNMLFIRYI